MRDWQHLQTLLVFSENKTLARAAEVLGIDRSTVSRRIESLENDLRVSLVERMGRDLVLTEAGHQAVRAAEHMRAQTLSLMTDVSGRDEVIEGAIRLTTTPKLANLLSHSVSRFLRTYPGVELDINATNDAQNLDMMEADVALRLTRTPPEQLVGKPLLHPASALYASPEHAAALSHQASIPYIGWGFDVEVMAWLSGVLESEVNMVASANDMELVKSMVREGLGVGFLPCYCVTSEEAIEQVSPPYTHSMP